MKVKAIELRRLSIPFSEAMSASYGSQNRKECILARVETDDAVGYGECSAFADPYYLEETVDTAWLIMNRYLVPTLLSHEIAAPEDATALWQRVRGHRMAKAGLEAAVWDAFAQSQSVSLATLMGAHKTEIYAGISVGLYATHKELLQRIERALSEGYRRVKVKIAPGQDVSVLAAVRTAFGAISLSADANGAYSLTDVEHLRRLDDFALDMIEQPLAFDDLLDHAVLAQQLHTPICLDESIRCAEDGRTAIALGACSVICIKYGRMGGLAQALSLLENCAAQGVAAWCGGMYETGVGRLANIALAAHDAITQPGDISPSDRYFDEDIVDPPVQFAGKGMIAVPTAPGIGAHVRLDVVERHTVLCATYRL